jgi:hypothetical protein
MNFEKVKKKVRKRCGLRAAWGGYPGSDLTGEWFFSYLPKNSFMQGDAPKNKCTPAIVLQWLLFQVGGNRQFL